MFKKCETCTQHNVECDESLVNTFNPKLKCKEAAWFTSIERRLIAKNNMLDKFQLQFAKLMHDFHIVNVVQICHAIHWHKAYNIYLKYLEDIKT